MDKARKIIGNDVIVSFLAYNIKHLDWIKNYKNALFSNEQKFYEYYLEIFEDSIDIDEIELGIISLKEEMEKHYGVNFNFDDNFLDYPNFKENGQYTDLTFNNKYN